MRHRSVQKSKRHSASRKKAALVIALVILLTLIGGQSVTLLGFSDISHLRQTAVPLILLLFIVAAAIPFVPGAEIGFALLMVIGADVAAEVYLSMIAALSLAYSIGRLIPVDVVRPYQNSFVARSRLLRLRSRAVGAGRGVMIVDFICRYIGKNRYLALALVLNIPGNSLLGGGGGLAMMAGASRLYSPASFFVTIAIATLPIPLSAVLLG